MTLTTKRKWMKARAVVPVIRQEESAHKPEPDEGDGDDE